MDIQILEKNFNSKVRSDVDSVMTTDETRVQGLVLSVIDNIVIPRVDLAINSVNASSGHCIGSVVLDPDRGYFSGNDETFQMTTSDRSTSHADLNKIDETCDLTTLQGGHLLLNEKSTDHKHTLITW